MMCVLCLYIPPSGGSCIETRAPVAGHVIATRTGAAVGTQRYKFKQGETETLAAFSLVDLFLSPHHILLVRPST